MSKRSAVSELTHDNWDQEEESEEPGKFRSAEKTALSRRPIKTGKRRLGAGVGAGAASSGQQKSGSGVFAGFSGFQQGKKSPTSTAHVPSIKTPTPPKTSPPQKSFAEACKERGLNGKGEEASSVHPPSPLEEKFLKKLKGLNEQVSAWIGDNIKDNPYVDLTPVFSDYQNHFNDLERAFKEEQKQELSVRSEKMSEIVLPDSSGKRAKLGGEFRPPEPGFLFSSTNHAEKASVPKTSFPIFDGQGDSAKAVPSNKESVSLTSTKLTFGISSDTSKQNESAIASPAFSFGQSVQKGSPAPSFGLDNNKTDSATPILGFGKSGKGSSTTEKPLSSFGGGLTGTKTTGFSFGTGITSAAPFTFGAVAPNTNTEESAVSGEKETEEQPYEPPKVETVELEEPGAFYQIRCKIFYKKEEKFVERALGTLYLKKLESSNKTQLLIRDGTALGTILLNIQLDSGIPCSRVGKNNVNLVCIPNPPMDPKATEEEKKTPTSLLIRVKSTHDADALLEKIKQTTTDPTCMHYPHAFFTVWYVGGHMKT